MQTLAETEIKRATRSKAHLEAFLLDCGLSESDIKTAIKTVYCNPEPVTTNWIIDVVNNRIDAKSKAISESEAVIEREHARLEELRSSRAVHERLIAEHSDV